MARLDFVGLAPSGMMSGPLSAEIQGAARDLARYHTALLAEEKGDLRGAWVAHRELLAQGTLASPDVVRRAMELGVRHGEKGEVEKLLRRLIAMHPKEAWPSLRLLEFLDAYRPDAQAEARAELVLKDVMTRFPADEEVIGTVVLRELVAGRRAEAGRLLRGTLELESPGGSAGYWLGLARLAQEVWPLGQTDRAEEHRTEVNAFYERVLERAVASKDTVTELEVAQFYVLTNQLGEARKVCERLAGREGNLSARKILYRLYEAEDLNEKALAVLEGLVRDDPKDVEQRRMLAEVLEQREDYAGAAKHLEAAIQVGSGSPADYEKLTNLWLGLRQPDKALTLVTRAIRLFPDSPGFLAQQGLAYSAKGDLDEAINAFLEAEKLGAAGGSQLFNHRFHFRFGTLLEQADRHEDAARQLRKSIEMTPDTEPEFLANTLNYLGYMWADLGQQLPEAEKLVRRAVEIEPENAAFLDSLGWVFHRQGRQEEALTTLLRARELLKELQPEDAEILEHLAAVQLALGKRQEALDTLEEAVDLNTPDEAVARRILETLKKLQPGPERVERE